MTASTLTPEAPEATEPTVLETLITEEIDFRVELRKLSTIEADGGLGLQAEFLGMKMPEHKATIRIDNDGTKTPLWVVGSRYEVVDHREIIKQFAEALDKADMKAKVTHSVYKGGCRIYSFFTLDKAIDIPGKEEKAYPFFTLTTSHDGALRLGFMMGAKVGKHYINVSKTMYGATAKHTRGINIDKTLEEVSKALSVFTDEVIPMWQRMNEIALTPERVKSLVDNAVKRKIISKKNSENLVINQKQSIWEIYTQVVKEVTKVPDRVGSTKERAFWRNVDVSEYFTKMMTKDTLAKTIGLETEAAE